MNRRRRRVFERCVRYSLGIGMDKFLGADGGFLLVSMPCTP